MFNFLKRKKKIESNSDDLIDILVNYIFEAKRLKWEDEEIKDKFREKGYSKELINLVFEIYKVKGGKGKKMVLKKKKEVEEEEDLELEEENEEPEEEEAEEEEEERPVKKSPPQIQKKEVEKSEVELTSEQISAVLTNHETRIRELEAFNYRLKSV
jgi:stringent starvation protein B